MAGSLSDFTEANVLNKVFGATDFTPGGTYYLALFTARGTDAQSDANTNWTEVTGGSYARKSVTNNTTNFPAASGTAPTSKSLNVAQTFATPTADWGTVIALGIYDASTSGNLIAWGTLTANQTINTGNTVTVDIGALTVTLD